MTTSAILGIPYIAGQQSQPEVTHNEAIALIQMITVGGAIEIGLNTPPNDPAEGDVYVTGEDPTDEWAGRPNVITGFFLGQWLFVPGNDSNGTPITMGPDQEGLQIWSKADDASYIWTDSGVSPGALTWQVLPTNITALQNLTDTNVSFPADNDLLIYRDGMWANFASNTIFVFSEAQLPAAIAGVRTLAANKQYWLLNDIDIGSDRIVCPAGVTGIFSHNFFDATLTSTTSGPLISGVDCFFNARDVAFDCPNAEVFDFSETVGGTTAFSLDHVRFVSCAKIGTLADLVGCTIRDCFIFTSSADGLTVTGSTWLTLIITQFIMATVSDTFIGLDISSAVINSPKIEGLDILEFGSPSTAIGIKADGNNSVQEGTIGTIRNCRFNNGIPFDGIDVDTDFRWNVSSNSVNVKNTRPEALVSLTGNATTTTIASTSVPVKLAGTWVVQKQAHFTADTTGRITYDGERDLDVSIDVVVSAAQSSGSNHTLRVYIAIDGTVVTPTGLPLIVGSAGNAQLFKTIWETTLSQNQYVEVFIQDQTAPGTVLAGDALIRVSA